MRRFLSLATALCAIMVLLTGVHFILGVEVTTRPITIYLLIGFTMGLYCAESEYHAYMKLRTEDWMPEIQDEYAYDIFKYTFVGPVNILVLALIKLALLVAYGWFGCVDFLRTRFGSRAHPAD